MKLKYFIPSLVAVVAAVFTSCSDGKDATYLEGIRVSQSYVALNTAGGSASIDVTTNGSWTVTEVPKWLTVSPASGTGNGTITFSADAAEGRSGSVKLNCGDETQIINIIQGLVTISPATCAEVLAGPDSKTYQVTGTVTSIVNTTYGNWYLNDGTGEVYIYGTLDSKGSTKNFSSWGLEVGDQITVQGPKTTYNGTVELVDVTVVKIVKSLIKVDSLTVGGVKATELPVAGGEITAHLTCKGTGVAVEIPADAKDWLGVTSSTVGATPTVTFYAKANEGGDRETTVTFKTTDGSKEYSSQATISQKGAIVECSIADFLAAAVGNTQFRLTGVITKIAKAEYGNIYIKDYSGETYVYGVGSKGDFEKLGLKEGDVITLVGKRGEYKGTAQMTGGQFEKSIKVTEVSIADFLDKEDSKDVYYRVSGTIDEIANDTYGNLYITDGTNRLYVYGTYPGWGATGDNRKGAIKNLGIAVGDKLTVIGVKSTYKGTPQVNGGIYFSHEKAE
jgi:DNA/RNA endonuclease YhcR with UshA esterase domain